MFVSIGGHRGVFRGHSSFGSGAVCMCSTHGGPGETAVLYEGKIEVYVVSESGNQRSETLFSMPTVDKCYSISFSVPGDLRFMPPCKFGGRISACPLTSDIYVLDEFSRVRLFERKNLSKKDTLDKFFSGDNDTVHLNPGLQVKSLKNNLSLLNRPNLLHSQEKWWKLVDSVSGMDSPTKPRIWRREGSSVGPSTPKDPYVSSRTLLCHVNQKEPVSPTKSKQQQRRRSVTNTTVSTPVAGISRKKNKTNI